MLNHPSVRMLCNYSGATSHDLQGAWKEKKVIFGKYQQHL